MFVLWGAQPLRASLEASRFPDLDPLRPARMKMGPESLKNGCQLSIRACGQARSLDRFRNLPQVEILSGILRPDPNRLQLTQRQANLRC